jgi:electron transfer flavoprotein beta subunit
VKIVVLFKKTPDTEAKIKIGADSKSIDFTGTKFIINPYDEFAIEEALQTQAKHPGSEVVIVSFGDESMRELFIKGLGMGADRGILVNNAGLEDLDSLSVAKILAAVVKSENAQLVFTGRHAIDDDNMHVGAMVAELLNIPHINVATKLEVRADSLTAERAIEGGQVEVYEAKLPAVIGADKSLNQPRFVSLPGLMKAKKKPLDVKTPADFGVNVQELKDQSYVKISSFAYPPEKPKGKILKGEPVDVMVEKVVKLLREEAKII